jgi:hypothetical protein
MFSKVVTETLISRMPVLNMLLLDYIVLIYLDNLIKNKYNYIINKLDIDI